MENTQKKRYGTEQTCPVGTVPDRGPKLTDLQYRTVRKKNFLNTCNTGAAYLFLFDTLPLLLRIAGIRFTSSFSGGQHIGLIGAIVIRVHVTRGVVLEVVRLGAGFASQVRLDATLVNLFHAAQTHFVTRESNKYCQ